MKKSAFVALGAMLVTGSALASNTGFKLNYPLAFSAGGSNQNWVSFPSFYFPNGNLSVSQQNAFDACADLNDFQTPPTKVNQLVKWVSTTSQPLVQFCTSGKSAYNLTAGEAYAAVPPGPGIVVNIVGSNNDAFAPNKGGTTTYPLSFLPTGSSNQNWVSVPYHTTADNAFDLCSQFQAQTGNKISQVVKWVTLTSQPLVQFCSSGKSAYNVTPGEGYSVVPSAAGLSIGFNVY